MEGSQASNAIQWILAEAHPLAAGKIEKAENFKKITAAIAKIKGTEA